MQKFDQIFMKKIGFAKVQRHNLIVRRTFSPHFESRDRHVEKN